MSSSFYTLIGEIIESENQLGARDPAVGRFGDFLSLLFNFEWNDKNILNLKRKRPVEPNTFFRSLDPLWLVSQRSDSNLFFYLLKYNIVRSPLLEDYLGYRCEIPSRIDMPFELDKYLRRLENFSRLSDGRLLKILWGLEAIVIKENSDNLLQKVQCLKIIFQFSPEPFITSAEIMKIIKHVAGQKVSENLVEEAAKVFEGHFPESAGAYEPRSLQHLSGCVVRQQLKKAERFPDGVKMLRLPDILASSVSPMEIPAVERNYTTHLEIHRDQIFRDRSPLNFMIVK